MSEQSLSKLRREVILDHIMTLEETIRLNGVSAKDTSRNWAWLAHYHGRMGDPDQQLVALQKALQLNPHNSFAKTQLKNLQHNQ